MTPPYEPRYGSTAGRGTDIWSISEPAIRYASVHHRHPEANSHQPVPASGCCARRVVGEAGQCAADRGPGGEILGFVGVDDLSAGLESTALRRLRGAAPRRCRAPVWDRAWIYRR